MVKFKSLVVIKFLLGVYVFQVLLPLVLIFSIKMVNIYQHSLLEKFEKDHNLFVKLELGADEFAKLVFEKDEFTYKNELYDLKNREHKNGKVILTVIKDVTEKKLKLVNHDVAKRTTKNALKLLKSYQLLFTLFESKEGLKDANPLILSVPNFYNIKLYDDPYTKVLSPPPDFA